jgi:hypothetical protein
MLTQPPPVWYLQPRNPNNCLQSTTPVCVSLVVGNQAKKLLVHALDCLATLTREGVCEVLLGALELAMLITFDGRDVVVCDKNHTATPAPMLGVHLSAECLAEWFECARRGTYDLVRTIAFDIDRKVPLSKSVGGCTLRIVFKYAGEYIISDDFRVMSKQQEIKGVPASLVPRKRGRPRTRPLPVDDPSAPKPPYGEDFM